MSDESTHQAIQDIIPGYTPLNGDGLSAYAVEGQIPRFVVKPDSLETLAGLMRLASERNLAVIPRGGGSRMEFGRPPERVDMVMLLDGLNRILEYEPAEQTITAQAGITLTALQDCLGQSGQYLPLDPPFSDGTTLGGILATNASGPLRWSYGTARDMVIGMKSVQADGSMVRSGGKVVKNVAGYDLNKMHIGSLGTLGVIAEVTLKVQPLPQTGRAIIGRFPFISTVLDTGLKILDSGIMPTFVELTNPVPVAVLARRVGGGMGDAGFSLIVGAVGSEETVSWQIAETERLFQDVGAVEITHLESDRYRMTREMFQEFPTGTATPRGMLPGVVCCASVLPSDIGHLYQVAEDTCQKLLMGCGMLAHFGNGAVVFVFYPNEPFTDRDYATLVRIISALQTEATALGGHMTVERAPAPLRRQVEVWGKDSSAFSLMTAIKKRFDPQRILNPGRFTGEI